MDFGFSKILLFTSMIFFSLFLGCKSEDIQVETFFSYSVRPDLSCLIELSQVSSESYEFGKALVTFNEGVSSAEKDFMADLFGISLFSESVELNQRVYNVPMGSEKEWVCTFVTLNIIESSELYYHQTALQ